MHQIFPFSLRYYSSTLSVTVLQFGCLSSLPVFGGRPRIGGRPGTRAPWAPPKCGPGGNIVWTLLSWKLQHYHQYCYLSSSSLLSLLLILIFPPLAWSHRLIYLFATILIEQRCYLHTHMYTPRIIQILPTGMGPKSVKLIKGGSLLHSCHSNY